MSGSTESTGGDAKTRSAVELRAILPDIDSLGPPFRVEVGTQRRRHRTPSRESAERWFHAEELTEPTVVREMVVWHADTRGMPVGRHAASLAFQRYCHRICGVASAAWFTHDLVLNLTASNTWVRFVSGTPDLVSMTEPAGVCDRRPEVLVATVVDDHLLRVADTIKAETGPGLGNLWGNIAAGFAGAFQKLAQQPHADSERIREQAEAVLATRPQLQRAGSCRVLDGPNGPRLFYDRASCCHWYAAPDGRFCSWCSRLTQAERTRRFTQSMLD